MAEKTLQHTIGLILSNVTNDFSGYLLELMGEQFTAHGYRLIVTTTNHRVSSECEMLQMFGQLTDGILIMEGVAMNMVFGEDRARIEWTVKDYRSNKGMKPTFATMVYCVNHGHRYAFDGN